MQLNVDDVDVFELCQTGNGKALLYSSTRASCVSDPLIVLYVIHLIFQTSRTLTFFNFTVTFENIG